MPSTALRPFGPSIAFVLAMLLAACTLSSGPGGSRVGNPDKRNLDEIVVVTSNAHQFQFNEARIAVLARSIRSASDGDPPDVIFLQEIESVGMRELARALNDLIPAGQLAPAGPTGRLVKAKALVNLSANDVEAFSVWSDPCAPRNRYLELRLSRRGTAHEYTAAGVHLPWDATSECREKSALVMKRRLGTGRAVLAGDFNSRPVVEQRECDPAETSDPLPWYSILTSHGRRPAFLDSVKEEALRMDRSVGDQWTYEGVGPTLTCDGSQEFRRNRIDYIFARDMSVIRAGADDPGWAGQAPGTYACRDEEECRYSDHRFVLARLELNPE